jgi:hypothetical protein
MPRVVTFYAATDTSAGPSSFKRGALACFESFDPAAKCDGDAECPAEMRERVT